MNKKTIHQQSAGGYFCPLIKSECKGVDCMAWQDAPNNMGSCDLVMAEDISSPSRNFPFLHKGEKDEKIDSRFAALFSTLSSKHLILAMMDDFRNGGKKFYTPGWNPPR